MITALKTQISAKTNISQAYEDSLALAQEKPALFLNPKSENTDSEIIPVTKEVFEAYQREARTPTPNPVTGLSPARGLTKSLQSAPKSGPTLYHSRTLNKKAWSSSPLCLMTTSKSKRMLFLSSQRLKMNDQRKQISHNYRADKIRSLELRLKGTKKSIQSLEKEKRQKDQIIKQLQVELERAKRFQKGENSDPNMSSKMRKSHSHLNASSMLQQRKKEKNFEQKIKELESVISKDRKHMSRLQSLNTQLLSKIKGITNSEKSAQLESTNFGKSLKELRSENNHLKHDKRQVLEEYKDLKQDFNSLIEDHERLKGKYKNLSKQSKIFEENALELYESHQILTEKIMKFQGS